MKEIEVKILEIDRGIISEKLVNLGAKKVFDGDIQTVFFDFKDGSIVKAKNVLRLRKEKDKAELTFKRVSFSQAAKEAEEYNVEVESIEKMEKILENLGLHQTEDTLKHRISYKIGDVRFDIDQYLGKYDFIPEFMEIEAENADVIQKYAQLLGFKHEDCLSWSTNDLIQHYSNIKASKNKTKRP